MPASPQKIFTQSAASLPKYFCVYEEKASIYKNFFGNNNSNIIYTCRLFSFICPPFACLSLPNKLADSLKTLFYYEIILRTHMTSSSSLIFCDTRVRNKVFFFMKSETTMKMEYRKNACTRNFFNFFFSVHEPKALLRLINNVYLKKLSRLYRKILIVSCKNLIKNYLCYSSMPTQEVSEVVVTREFVIRYLKVRKNHCD